MMRKIEVLERIFLVIVAVTAFIYSFDLGYLITNYGHGGQFFGLPIAFVFLAFSALLVFTKKRKLFFRILVYNYLLSIISYVVMVNVIKFRLGDDSYSYLHYFDIGSFSLNEKLFFCFLLGGFVSTVIFVLISKYRKKRSV